MVILDTAPSLIPLCLALLTLYLSSVSIRVSSTTLTLLDELRPPSLEVLLPSTRSIDMAGVAVAQQGCARASSSMPHPHPSNNN